MLWLSTADNVIKFLCYFSQNNIECPKNKKTLKIIGQRLYKHIII